MPQIVMPIQVTKPENNPKAPVEYIILPKPCSRLTMPMTTLQVKIGSWFSVNQHFFWRGTLVFEGRKTSQNTPTSPGFFSHLPLSVLHNLKCIPESSPLTSRCDSFSFSITPRLSSTTETEGRARDESVTRPSTGLLFTQQCTLSDNRRPRLQTLTVWLESDTGEGRTLQMVSHSPQSAFFQPGKCV